jgi:hypothetical protein
MDPNPYETPKHVEPGKSPGKAPVRRAGLAMVLGLLAIPAAGIAFFATCTVSSAVSGQNYEVPLVVGAGCGIAVAVAMFYYSARAAGGK